MCGQLTNPMVWLFIRRHADKYVRRGRLDWPEGATSRESIRAVLKLPRLQVGGAQKNLIGSCWYYKMHLCGLDILSNCFFFFSSLSEPCNAACRSFGGEFDWSPARPSQIWSNRSFDCTRSPSSPFLYKGSSQEVIIKYIHKYIWD